MNTVHTQRIRVSKRFHFEMAHALTGHDGPCAHIHGHSYVLDVTVIGQTINEGTSPKNGMVIDFTDLKRIVNQEVIDRFDHALVLNATERSSQSGTPGPLFSRMIFTPYQPTCENLVQDIAARIAPLLPSHVDLHALRLMETPTSWAEWNAEDR